MPRTSSDMTNLTGDQPMLTFLLVDFIRETGIEFSVFDNPKFHAIADFLRPGVELPTCADMIKFFGENYEAFDKCETNAIENLENDHDANSEEWIEVDVVDDNEEFYPEGYSKSHILQDSVEMSSNVMSSQMQDMRFIDPNTGLGYGEVFKNANGGSKHLEMTNKCLAIVEENYSDHKIAAGSWQVPSIGSRYTNLVNILSVQSSESSSSSSEDGFNKMNTSPVGSLLRTGSSSSQNLNSYASSSLVPAVESFMNVEIKQEELEDLPFPEYFLGCKTIKTANNLMILESDCGNGKWPCFVCTQHKETTQMRQMNDHDGYIMIFACIKNGLYSVETGRQMSRLHMLKCCISHLDYLHNSALKHLEIRDPSSDTNLRNNKVVAAYYSIKDIRNTRFSTNKIVGGSKRHILTFCNLLRRFFERYGRHNYIPFAK